MTWVWYWLGTAGILVFIARLLWVLAHAEAYQSKIAGWCAMINNFVGMSRFEFSRTIVPLTMLSFTVALMNPLFLPLALRDDWTNLSPAHESAARGAFIVGMMVMLGAVVGFAIATLTTKRLSRPRLLILKPCRDMSKSEVEAWLSPPSAPKRQVRRPAQPPSTD